MNNNRTKATKRIRKPNNRRRKRAATNMFLNQPIIPRNLRGNSPFPESRIVKLSAIHNYQLAGAALFSVKDFNLNSLFNFQSSSTNDFSGTTQLAAIYDSYHVQSLKVSFQLAANEPSIPVAFGLSFKDEQVSVSVTTLAHAVNALEVSPTTGAVIIGETTGMSVYRSRTFGISCGAIVGNPLSYAADISYTSSFGMDPNQKVYMGAIAYSLTGTNITNGVIVSQRTELIVRVYSIKTLLE